ncbi:MULTISPECIES: dihydroxyacetone kinase phosphoryl donor subunit DhaM [Enterococcus]|jgi:dihydroxyacetone kinase phosphotransfer subunit|uniref:phosphoenolpyruvate--glycerone phosphotransferase n=1 Tax=Enterococcus dispar ATCC 51266 TaxID=1139219 RepID=S1NJQ0_9ENTE|nr:MULTISPECIES: dihydroxyacetone kinase phosphoryl donor subunit DhaM [Enterococcus]EOT38380.1 dihydroxyacetone kinase, phosphotransfer subunit [Enterococcus dispar ATCC 51266]EOW85933.1 dihydroxyacetone kinase, phosphotransfer subunit [Enterococcus dispar ATCC 51266]MCU7356895.1 dihydroxyacetone kinase phosphoryl donor subunit DhaM [Enterococcus dispar]MDT2704997.1 dihydroxyacetone kinase phosphoryl donor subunit DhaM [Enterococcus dispar]MDT2738898.1 dihydroxyacetone kinase phosphoryl donor
MKKSIFLVSHSKEITDGIKAMVEQMAQKEEVAIFSLGGTAEGQLGSDPTKIMAAVEASQDAAVYLVFADLGSAVLSAELAFDLLAENDQKKYRLVDAPLVEGAFAAAITAGITDDVEQIMTEAKQAGKKGW